MNEFQKDEIAAIYKVIAERRDIRHFLPDPLAPELLTRLLRAAHLAPSVGFMQPWRFIRITDLALRTNIHRLVEEERVNTARALGERETDFMRLKVEGIRECGELLVAALMDRRDKHIFGRRTMPEMDLASLACAIQNLWLATRAEGIGMGWVSLFDPEQLRALLRMPSDARPVAILCLGHVEAFYPKPMLEMEGWAGRQPLQEVVYENSWRNEINFGSSGEDKMKKCDIRPVSRALAKTLQHKIDNKTKPLGALGKLETLALRVGLIQNTLTPRLQQPVMLVFAGDHGITEAGVSPYPQAVTQQMVLNFLNGGAAINVLARQNGIALRVIDAGVNADFHAHPALIDAKIAKGTRNFLAQPAMTREQCEAALEKGAELAEREIRRGSNVMGFGEMGIGNTSSAAALMSILGGFSVEECVGRGAGLDDAGLVRKREVIRQAVARHSVANDPKAALAAFGGFEIAMMAGAMLQAAQSQTLLLIDGFIVTAALLVASKLDPAILDYCVFSHQSDESGHALLLQYFKAEPLLQLNMRLGEGTGSAVAYPLLLAAVNFLNDMASFESAGVSKKAE
ncbi:MAG: nicotinate-nucleotide--dimethylbenzimidazole phosphoribosyltransferase [Acidiferrobacterales bacterium]